MNRGLVSRTCVAVTLVLLCATVARSAEADDRLVRMTKWFHSISNVNKRVSFENGGFGSGVYVSQSATKPVVTHENVMAVPMLHVLSRDSIIARPYADLLSPLGEEDMIAAALLIENAFGVGSKLHPWLSALPRLREGLDPPHTWSTEEISRITPTNVRFEVEKRRRDLQLEHLRLVSQSDVIFKIESFVERALAGKDQSRLVITHKLSSLPDGTTTTGRQARLQLLSVFTLANYTWARSLLDTRAWNLEGRKYLVPGADMFNHHPDRTDVKFDAQKRPVVRQRSQKFVEHHRVKVTVTGEDPNTHYALATSDRGPIPPGTELFESYGDNTDSIYFVYHGFVPSTPEAFLPKNRSATPKAERKRLSDLWLNERVRRNAWDCQPVSIRPAKWTPASETVVGGPVGTGGTQTDAQRRALRDLRRGEVSPPKTEPPERLANRDERAAAAWYRDRVSPVLQRNGYGARDAATCTFYGELDPALTVFHLINVLPEHIITGACVTKIRVNDRASTYLAALDDVYVKLVRCLSENVTAVRGAPHPENNPIVSAAAWQLTGYKALLASMRWHWIDLEFPEWATKGRMSLDDDVAVIGQILAAAADDENAQAMPEWRKSRALTTLRFALQRKMIAREAHRQLKRHMKRVTKALGDELRVTEVSGASTDEIGEL